MRSTVVLSDGTQPTEGTYDLSEEQLSSPGWAHCLRESQGGFVIGCPFSDSNHPWKPPSPCGLSKNWHMNLMTIGPAQDGLTVSGRVKETLS